jgi:Holliday junction resolvasome RuvABC endonuclease subunit
MVVLGFDQSTTKTGWCVFIDGQYESSGVIDFSYMKKEPEKRLMTMANKICRYIDSYQPDKVIIEDIFEHNNVQTLVALGRLQGAIMLHCFKKKCPIEILMPSTWRKMLHMKQGKRAEMKAAAIKYVKDNYGFEANADEADAVCITQAACIQ